MGTCLWANGVAYGRCAAAAWELEGGRWRPPEIAAAKQMKKAPFGAVVRRITTLDPIDVTRIGVLPVTSALRTVIDLAAFVPEATLEIAFEQLLRVAC
jgi:hypothetical protein